MEEGLQLGEKEFMSMSPKKQLCVLYQNQVETLKLIRGYRLNQKIQYVALSACIGGLGILFSIQLGL